MKYVKCAVFCFFFPLFAFAQTASVDSKNKLRHFADEDALTLFSRNNNGINAQIIADGTLFTEKRYDELMRLIKKTVFDFTHKILQTVTYTYEKESPYIKTKIEQNNAANKYTETHYGNNNLAEKQNDFTVNEKGEKTLVKSTEWKYDAQKRIIQKTITAANTISTDIFEYINGQKEPNSSHFENGKKTSEKKYAADTLIETHYFPDGTTIKTEYVDGNRFLEKTEKNGIILKEKKFEIN